MLNPAYLHPLATTASPSGKNSSNIFRSNCNTTAGSRQQAGATTTTITNITTSTSCLPMTYQDAVAVVVPTGETVCMDAMHVVMHAMHACIASHLHIMHVCMQNMHVCIAMNVLYCAVWNLC